MNINEKETEACLPSHTQYMRRAVMDLRCGIKRLRAIVDDSDDSTVDTSPINDQHYQQLHRHRETIHSAWSAAQRYLDERHDALDGIICRDASSPIDIVDMNNDGSSWQTTLSGSNNTPPKDASTVSPHSDCSNNKANDVYKFKQQYCMRNVPCLIRGLDLSHFAQVSSSWRFNADQLSGIDKANTSSRDKASTSIQINTDWFRRFVGDDTIVPVRVDNCDDCTINGSGGYLDDDGRARECGTKEMKLSEWIFHCKQQKQKEQEQQDDNQTNDTTKLYLKDWHLARLLAEKQHTGSNDSIFPLYTTPPMFERDLLNNFLQRYSDGGDYKFCYWGLAGSRTRLHSDVLHSFSWSYNVVGKKKWTFHIPQCHNEISPTSFEMIQHAGETMFVPATWKHEVINLVETLSINHNWITSANIDMTYECLKTEILSVEDEIGEWGVVPIDDYEARENMLRGCIGMDVTLLVLMALLESVELMETILCIESRATTNKSDIWHSAYSIFRLQQLIADIFRENNARLNIFQRLKAILYSKAIATEVQENAKYVLDKANMFATVTSP
jgi:hypothetical protein